MVASSWIYVEELGLWVLLELKEMVFVASGSVMLLVDF